MTNNHIKESRRKSVLIESGFDFAKLEKMAMQDAEKRGGIVHNDQ
jgi:hypothetical protein